MDMNLGKLQETVRDREAWLAEAPGVTVRHDWVTEQQQYHFTCDFSKAKRNFKFISGVHYTSWFASLLSSPHHEKQESISICNVLNFPILLRG